MGTNYPRRIMAAILDFHDGRHLKTIIYQYLIL